MDENNLREQIARALYPRAADRGYDGDEALKAHALARADAVMPLVSDALAAVEAERTLEEWVALMDAERERQVAKGYDETHDREHGVKHLLTWAIDYARRGRTVEAATMMRSAMGLVAAVEAERDAARAVIDRIWEIEDVIPHDHIATTPNCPLCRIESEIVAYRKEHP